jgi:threonine aldolase
MIDLRSDTVTKPSPGMRQAGILAAAGLYALRHNVERLADDHDRARRLAAALDLDPVGVETNILMLPVPDAVKAGEVAAEHGVLISVLGPTVVRLVTHLGVDDKAIDRAIEVLRPLLV